MADEDADPQQSTDEEKNKKKKMYLWTTIVVLMLILVAGIAFIFGTNNAVSNPIREINY